MEKIIITAILALTVMALFATGFTIDNKISFGPAPSSGDGIPEGSGWSVGDIPSQGTGPSLCSGDGIPDGSCWG